MVVLVLLAVSLPVAGQWSYYVPPGTTHRDIQAACDLDGDGVLDLVENALETGGQGTTTGGETTIFARSGQNGSELWRADGAAFNVFVGERGISLLRGGMPDPRGPNNLALTDDLNGDGVCDLVTWGLRGRLDSIVTPIIGSPAVRNSDIVLRLLDGATGNQTWETVLPQTTVTVFDWPYRFSVNQQVLNLPTDLRVHKVGNETQILLKTTDVTLHQNEDRFGILELVVQNEIWTMDGRLRDHFIVFDGNGQELWRHDRPPADPNETNITWISGLTDLNNDGQPDIILDQLVLANPRGNEMEVPALNEQPYRNGRGMRMLAIDGNLGGEGEILWASEIRPLVPVEPQTDNEEGVEVLSWTHARLGSDVTGDGVPDIMAQWLGIEQLAGVSIDGSARTHFLRLDGATGEIAWQALVQGWGFVHELGSGTYAAATTDLPSQGSTQFLATKGARLVGLDGESGERLWTREQDLIQGDAAFAMAQWQWYHDFQTGDMTGDGIVDPVMPARMIGALGTEQVFRATARVAFDRIDGATGDLLGSYEAWGLSGVMTSCGDGVAGAFVGHSERLELVRWQQDPDLLQPVVDPTDRHQLWSLAEPRSSTLGVDLVGLAASCEATREGLLISSNMERYSFWRQFEIFPSFGIIDVDGPRWLLPATTSGEDSPALLQESALHRGRFIQSAMELIGWMAVAVAAGIIGALLLAPLLRRRRDAARRRRDPLGIMLMLLLIPTPGMIGFDTADDEADAAVILGDEANELAELDLSPPEPAGTLAPPPTEPKLAGNGEGPTSNSRALPPGSLESSPVNVAPSIGDAAKHLSGGPPRAMTLPGGGPLSDLALALSTPESSDQEIALAFLAAAGQPIDPLVTPEMSITFDHILGDVDGDGVDDVAVDISCLDYFACANTNPSILGGVAWVEWFLAENWCGPYHVVVAVSGASGQPLWDRMMTRPAVVGWAEITTCSVDAIIGPVQTAEGSALLAQRFEWDRGLFDGPAMIRHEVYLVDGATGATRWSIPFEGYYLDSLFGQNVAETLLVKPHLSIPQDTLPNLQGTTEPQLLLQGIGFVANAAILYVSGMGLNRAPEVADTHYPREWMAGVDLDTGTLTYQADTLSPSPGRSVLPWPSVTAPFANANYGWYWDTYPDAIPQGNMDMYWDAAKCCPDVDGDGVADLVTVTREWRDIRTANVDGREGFGMSAYAWSGADGRLLFDQELVDNLPIESANGRGSYPDYDNGITVDIRPAGDVDGDGGQDLLVQLRAFMSDYEDRIYVLDGDTGSTIWERTSPRWQEIHPLGDADGDGGLDFVFMHWWRQENTIEIAGDGSNVTARGIQVLDGNTGEMIRVTNTISAPYDLAAIYARMADGGFPDLDGDGVGDYPTDDPIFLPDGLILHQTTWASGATGELLVTMQNAGTLAFPNRLPDLDEDGLDDVAMVAGDSTDLWLVYHSGGTGEALSSHRLMAAGPTTYARILPKIKVLPLDTGDVVPGVLVNMHLEVTKIAFTFEWVDGDGNTYREFRLEPDTVAQMMYIGDVQSGQGWSFPDATEVGAHEAVAGNTPGTAALLAIRQEAEPTPMEIASDFTTETWPVWLAFVASFGLVTLAAVFGRRRRA